MRIAFYTLGCKVNQYETEALKSRFSAEGFDIVEPSDDAEVYVVNSCTVTATGDKKTRQVLRRFKRQNPSAVIALTGCMPQAFPQEAEHLPEAQVITGSYHRASLVGNIKKALATGERIVDIIPHQKGERFEAMETRSFSGKTRAFVKIEDGCDRYCAYCIIPKARGPVRSKPLAALSEELSALAASGYREVVLVGINLSSYGRDIGLRMVDAVETACVVEGIERVRLGSLEPELLTDEDIRRLAVLPKFCPQFHLSLQSGCDATLTRMGRGYDTAFYRDLAGRLREHFPDCAITTDIMVGFPGETEEEFQKSLQFACETGLTQAHVFAYSVREGTRAAGFPNQVDSSTKERRSRQMIGALASVREAYLRSFVGRELEVLFESSTHTGQLGHARNFLPVMVSCEDDLSGQIHTVVVTKITNGQCVGKLHR